MTSPERSEKVPHDGTGLPEWIDLGGINACDCSDCDYVVHLHDALTVAWLALNQLKWGDETQQAKDAMRRIESLGKWRNMGND